jgi:hypothetical protein
MIRAGLMETPATPRLYLLGVLYTENRIKGMAT